MNKRMRLVKTISGGTSMMDVIGASCFLMVTGFVVGIMVVMVAFASLGHH